MVPNESDHMTFTLRHGRVDYVTPRVTNRKERRFVRVAVAAPISSRRHRGSRPAHCGFSKPQRHTPQVWGALRRLLHNSQPIYRHRVTMYV